LTGRPKFGIETAVSILRRAVALALALLVSVVLGCTSAGTMRPAAPPARIATAPSAAPRRPASRTKRTARRPHLREPSPVAEGPHECPTSTRTAVVARVNDARRAASLQPLKSDAGLGRAAQSRASAMASANQLSHTGWERVVRRHDDASTIGENVAYNYPSAAAVVDAWLRSPGHRANLLGRSFRRIGVGCVVDAHARLWWAQDFAD
jgi:uncharacterized protein YkwD